MVAIILIILTFLGKPEDRLLFDYFTYNRTTTGLVLDRESDRNKVSVAATGFGMDCWAVAAQKGKIPTSKAIEYVNKALDSTLANNPAKNKGWLYHFTDTDGKIWKGSEVSSIDTTLFYLGAKDAAKRLKDDKLTKRIDALIEKVDVNWMMDGKLFRHGLHWDGDTPVWIECKWDNYSEGVLIYKLFNKPYQPVKTEYNLPLFVYFYPLCFYNDKDMTCNLKKAVEYQKTKYGHWGVTACDGPDGYQTGDDKNLISPLAIWGLTYWYPDEVRDILGKLPVPRHTPAYHLKTGWSTKDRVGIDLGSTYILLSK